MREKPNERTLGQKIIDRIALGTPVNILSSDTGRVMKEQMATREGIESIARALEALQSKPAATTDSPPAHEVADDVSASTALAILQRIEGLQEEIRTIEAQIETIYEFPEKFMRVSDQDLEEYRRLLHLRKQIESVHIEMGTLEMKPGDYDFWSCNHSQFAFDALNQTITISVCLILDALEWIIRNTILRSNKVAQEKLAPDEDHWKEFLANSHEPKMTRSYYYYQWRERDHSGAITLYRSEPRTSYERAEEDRKDHAYRAKVAQLRKANDLGLPEITAPLDERQNVCTSLINAYEARIN